MTLKIVLIGYMGSGKTTVGEKLAEKLAVPFMDLDSKIEKLERMSISEIFETKGAIYFRKIENTLLKSIINSDNSMVLSLGGGTPCYFDSMNYLNDKVDVLTIYLDVTISELVNRLMPEIEKRPLLVNIKSEEDLTEFIGKHLFERRPFYQQAKLRFQVNNELPLTVVSRIVATLFQDNAKGFFI